MLKSQSNVFNKCYKFKKPTNVAGFILTKSLFADVDGTVKRMFVFVYVDVIWRQVCSCRCYLESCLCMDISVACKSCEVLLHAYSTILPIRSDLFHVHYKTVACKYTSQISL